jgi:superkiller protein 3
MVFLVRSFGLNYFIHRAPDFFDWRSGVFDFEPVKYKTLEN